MTRGRGAGLRAVRLPPGRAAGGAGPRLLASGSHLPFTPQTCERPHATLAHTERATRRPDVHSAPQSHTHSTLTPHTPDITPRHTHTPTLTPHSHTIHTEHSTRQPDIHTTPHSHTHTHATQSTPHVSRTCTPHHSHTLTPHSHHTHTRHNITPHSHSHTHTSLTNHTHRAHTLIYTAHHMSARHTHHTTLTH